MNGLATARTAANERTPPTGAFADPLPTVRVAVRELLLATPAFQQLDPVGRRSLAEAMVKVCHAAALLIREEIESDQTVRAAQPLAAAQSASSTSSATPVRRTLARAQGTGADFTPGAAHQIGEVTRSVLNAVSFPRFVAELINGVFKAMIDSSVQQMNAYVELLKNVSASLEGFQDVNYGPDSARAWLVERYPESFELSGEESAPDEPPEERDPDDRPQRTVRLRSGASMPSAAALRADLGLGENENVPTGDPDRALVPLVRRQLAKLKQQMLATMVSLGMQRIVIDSGRITAAMRFHVDTRSAVQEDRASRFDLKHESRAAGSFGIGIWGASASMSNTIGYVNTQTSMNTEEMNTDLELNSSVEINFRSDYLPLNRMASQEQANKIMANTLNPDAEAKDAARSAIENKKLNLASDKERQATMHQGLKQSTESKPDPEMEKVKKDAAAKQKEAAAKNGAKPLPSNPTTNADAAKKQK